METEGASTSLEAELPAAGRVLSVCAHPDDESFGLGGLLGTYVEQGADVAVLSLTRGEASTLGAEATDLAAARAAELEAASAELGASATWVGGFPDGGLAEHPVDELAAYVRGVLDEHRPEIVLVFHPEGITGHVDHRQATAAARLAVEGRAVEVWSWFVPADVATHLNSEFGTAFAAVAPAADDRLMRVDRRRQHRAMRRHTSQSGNLDIVARRLELAGEYDHLRPLGLDRT